MSQETEEILLDHSQEPRNRAPLESTLTHKSFVNNPSCGDELHVELVVVDGKVSAVRIDPKGCAVSKASASLFSEFILGKELSSVEDAGIKLSEGLKTGVFSEKLSELLNLESLSKFPMRHRCVLLPFEAFAKAVS